MNMFSIIEKKTKKEALSFEEMQYFITGFCKGEIPDYQASALIMAIYLNGMDEREITDLTLIMRDSGETMDLSSIPGIKVDKHSTGGIGDTTTMILTPIVAACGGKVAKMSGRGLGVATGTVDKLESIPGYRTALSAEEFLENVRDIGISLVGQTINIAPADKKIYAIRDVTATVKSLPLIATSVMSKKLASGADKFVLDVKFGTGALCEDYAEAEKLSHYMCKIGNMTGHETVCYMTNMNRPLGKAVGHLLEVQEAVETLKGNGHADVNELCTTLAAEMLSLAGIGTFEACRLKAEQALKDGSALAKFKQLVARQGGNFDVIENPSLFYPAPKEHIVYAKDSGYISFHRAEDIGIATAQLGAARVNKDSKIDFTAGLVFTKCYGDYIRKGEELCRLYSSSDAGFKDAEFYVDRAVNYIPGDFTPEPLISQIIRA